MLRSLLYSCIVILALACGSNDNSQSEKTEPKSDVVPRPPDYSQPQATPKPVELVNTTVYYDSLRKKMKGTPDLRRLVVMRLAFQDFYSYIADLKTQFYKFAGDAEGKQLPAGKENDANLTNQFFIEQGFAADLYGSMETVQSNLPPRITPRDDQMGLLDTMNPGGTVTGSDDFLNVYFKNVPAKAAASILYTFELKIKTIESNTLVKYTENNGTKKQPL